MFAIKFIVSILPALAGFLCHNFTGMFAKKNLRLNFSGLQPGAKCFAA
jgi:hypothetical protein